MKQFGLPFVALPALLLGARPLTVTSTPPAHACTALAAAADPALGALRAGRTREAPALSVAEFAALSRAQASAPELAAQRAGDLHLSDRDLKLIAIVLLVVLVISIA